MMILPGSQHPQTGVQSMFSEPEADLLLPGACWRQWVESSLCSYESREMASAASVFALLMLLLALGGHCIQIIHALLITPERCVLDLALSCSQHFSCAEAKGAVLTDLRKVRI